MLLKTLIPFRPPQFPILHPNFRISPQSRLNSSPFPHHGYKKHLIVTSCFTPSEGLVAEELVIQDPGVDADVGMGAVVRVKGKEEEVERGSLWDQMLEIMKFSGPAIGLWLCGPLMSLIDTAVIGQQSSLELAALGPGTVFCDYTSYIFMFLSIATSNMVATSLASQGKEEVQHQISVLLFVGFSCGILMLLSTRLMGAWALAAFTGLKNADIVPAANTYVQIRGLAWPAVLVGWVAQSASLGMKDSWGPLKALAVASVVNAVGDVVLCSYLGYGIAGAAWATMVSQVIAGFMMIQALNQKGYNGFAISVPSITEVLQIFTLAAPVFITMTSKVAFYSLLVYFATSMGTHTVAAHQVMLQLFSMCAVFGEPLSQTAQSFMPELMYGVNRSLAKARSLLKSLLIIGALSGLIFGAIGAIFPLMFPKIFSPDTAVISEMHKVLVPYFIALSISPSVHCLEGTLLAGRDLKFISLSMSGCFTLCSLLLMVASNRGYGLTGCWFTLVGFQWSRFFMALRRLLSSDGVLYSEDLAQKDNFCGRWSIADFSSRKLTLFSSLHLNQCQRRRTLICAVSKDAEESFKKTVEVDRLIDTLRDASAKELQQLVVENILAFNESFWIRLAARSDTCKSEDDKARSFI